MEQAPRPGTSDTLSELKTAAAGRPETAADRIHHRLSVAEGLPHDDASGLETDSAVLTAVRQAGKPDPILDLLPLESLAKREENVVRLDLLALMNGLTPDATLAEGQPIRIGRREPYRPPR